MAYHFYYCLLSAAIFSAAALALQSAYEDLCFAADVRLALAGDALYFMGGLYTFTNGNTDAVSNTIYSIPLNASFPTDSLLYSNLYRLGSGSGEAYYNQGAFFSDPNATTLYSFAGFKDPSSPIDTVLAFDTVTEQWSNPTVSGGSLNFDSRAAALEAASENTNLGLGFFSGGWVDIPGMIRFDASDPSNLKWTNETTNNPPLTLDGSMEFVRYGKQGALIAFGGYNKDYVDTALTGWSYDLRDMRQIGVYDIESATWYNVTAVGDIPANRSAFCTAVSTAPDDSSMQITMYGGWDLFGGHDFADVYVLTIPSFQWIDVTDRESVEYSFSPGDTVGRDCHKCQTYHDRTMLSVGGYVRFGSDWVNTDSCNRSWPVIRALDTSTYQWLDQFQPDIGEYYVPDAVAALIGGDGSGGATATQPAAGFATPALGELFKQTVPKYTPPSEDRASTTTGSGPSSASSSTTASSTDSQHNGGNDSSSSSKIQSGAIAGIAIAGVAALAMALGLAYFFLRRRRQSKAAEPIPEMTGVSSEIDFQKFGHNSYPYPQPQEVDGGYRGTEMDSGTTLTVHQRGGLVEMPGSAER